MTTETTIPQLPAWLAAQVRMIDRRIDQLMEKERPAAASYRSLEFSVSGGFNPELDPE